ncbi:LytR/AlgR family response regulator transcription factor [Winogradskyella immobilis]|uniref:LytTR family transcriptional regulator n=1 Tax=Winogradskyella immobilis TaxID=2816852 RepID=A0ABS8EJL0_9FLAO|nr:LytTR family DNA-binding domain-containing protein [Winogradskyella immobilis]MCC1483370.1 LytTR family transcriptional regulator [Winogradskyella immobilis]MCG0015464.1 LytTR family transcriptional regulator [Winogradskyella immobilis]
MSTKQPTKSTTKTIWHRFIGNSERRWFQKVIILIIFSLVVNHIATSDNFIDSKSYRFPIEGFLFTIVFSILIGIIADLNFKFYKKKYFYRKIETATIVKFMASTLGYITIIYIPVNIIVELVSNGQIKFYYILIGLLITLLLCFIFIGLWYALDIYDLYKLSIKDAEITIESGAKITKLTYENIACFYSENKIVYTVQNDGKTINTDFTLNELEEKINDQLFFRANRKIIVHKDAVDQIEKIENGKLNILLKSSFKNDAIGVINISRYKRKAFLDWFQ